MYNRGSILLSKSTRTVNKNQSQADKEHEKQEDAMKKKQQKMGAITEHRRIQMFGTAEEKKKVAGNHYEEAKF